MRLRTLLLLLALALPARAEIFTFAPITDGDSGLLTLGYGAPNHCSSTTTVLCRTLGKREACPPSEVCVAGDPLGPDAITARVDNPAIAHQCLAGVNIGDACTLDTDCPGSSCKGLLYGVTWLSPGASFTRVIPYRVFTLATNASLKQPTMLTLTLTAQWGSTLCAPDPCEAVDVGFIPVEAAQYGPQGP